MLFRSSDDRSDTPVSVLCWPFVLLASSMCLGLLTSCEVGDASGTELCLPGQTCICAGFSACSQECTGKACALECAGTGACTFLCPQGGCTARGTGNGATQLSCAGGGCSMTCTGAGACELTECTQGCALKCTGNGECTNSCKHATCSKESK